MSWKEKCWNCEKKGVLRDVDSSEVVRYTCIDCESLIRDGEITCQHLNR